MGEIRLPDTALFRGVSEEECRALSACLGAVRRQFARGETVYHAGEPVSRMGLVLSGSVNVELDDPWGNTTLLGRMGAGQLFAEVYACLPDEPLLVRVAAAEDTAVLFLDAGRLLTPCAKACASHSRLSRNLLQILARKNLALSRRSLHTAPKSIRGRVLSYLSEQARLHGSDRFTIPLDRQQMADHLNVDRSALSNELSKMRREGLLDFEKSTFTLHRLT